jgi:AraC-like DNA-binding protein
VTGVNFVDYVARMRIEKACDLLQDRHVRISEIAFAVGFQSLSQFNRVFKKLSGRSPSAYRAARRSRFPGVSASPPANRARNGQSSTMTAKQHPDCASNVSS